MPTPGRERDPRLKLLPPRFVIANPPVSPYTPRMQKSNMFWALVVCFVFLSPLTAQNQPSNPSSSSKSNRQFEEKVLDLVVPNTLIVEGRDTKVAPLTVGQKFGEVGKNFFNPFVFVGTG